MTGQATEPNNVSPVLKVAGSISRWVTEDQRGTGNLMTREKVLEDNVLLGPIPPRLALLVEQRSPSLRPALGVI